MEKDQILKIVLEYLEREPYTQIHSIRRVVEHELKNRDVMGQKTKGNQFVSTTWFEGIPNKEALLINEVIYDLLYERVLTPGINQSNLELPFIHVSNMEKLKKIKEE